MTIDNLKIPPVALGTWAWGDSGELGDGYFGSSLTRSGQPASGFPATTSQSWKRSLTRLT